MDLTFLINKTEELEGAERRIKRRREEGHLVSMLPPYAPIPLRRSEVRVEPFYEDDEAPAGANGGAPVLNEFQMKQKLTNEFGFSAKRVENALAMLQTDDVQKVANFLMEVADVPELDNDFTPAKLHDLHQLLSMGFSFSQSHEAMVNACWMLQSAVSRLLPSSSPTLSPLTYGYSQSSWYNTRSRSSSGYRRPLTPEYRSFDSDNTPSEFPWKFLRGNDLPKNKMFVNPFAQELFSAVMDEDFVRFRDFADGSVGGTDVYGTLDKDGNNLAHYACLAADGAFVSAVYDNHDDLFLHSNLAGEYPVEFAVRASSVLNMANPLNMTDGLRRAIEVTAELLETSGADLRHPRIAMWVNVQRHLERNRRRKKYYGS